MPGTALLACVLAAGCTAAGSAPVMTGASAAHPVVVELFQSQGYSYCPPANANLNALADRPEVLALSFAVTYWDRLGWRDVFAKPAFTARQGTMPAMPAARAARRRRWSSTAGRRWSAATARGSTR